MQNQTQATKGEMVANPFIEEMFNAGVHFGYSKSRRHPSAKPFIFGAKNNVEIIDLEKTVTAWARAKDFIAGLTRAGKQILFVGGKNEAFDAVVRTAISVEMPYAAHRWVGGTLTNFPQIKKRIAQLENLTSKREKAELDMYTKKERLMIDREIEDLEKKFGGLLGLKDMPGALFVVDSKREHIAVEEARKAKIPVISISSSDCDITGIQYPIVANDASRSSVDFFMKLLAEAIVEGKMSVPPAKQ